MKYLIMILIFTIPSISFADSEQDKKSGTCAMYLALAQKGNFGNYRYGPADALAMADKESRALQFSQIFADKVKEYQSRKESTSPLISQAIAACYDIGLRLK